MMIRTWSKSKKLRQRPTSSLRWPPHYLYNERELAYNVNVDEIIKTFKPLLFSVEEG